jgi:hypothetical protein
MSDLKGLVAEAETNLIKAQLRRNATQLVLESALSALQSELSLLPELANALSGLSSSQSTLETAQLALDAAQIELSNAQTAEALIETDLSLALSDIQEAEDILEVSPPDSDEYIQGQMKLSDAQRRRGDALTRISCARSVVIVAQSAIYTATSQLEDERTAIETRKSTLEAMKNNPFASITILSSELATAQLNRDEADAAVVVAQSALDAAQLDLDVAESNTPKVDSVLDNKIEQLNITLPHSISFRRFNDELKSPIPNYLSIISKGEPTTVNEFNTLADLSAAIANFLNSETARIDAVIKLRHIYDVVQLEKIPILGKYPPHIKRILTESINADVSLSNAIKRREMAFSRMKGILTIC